MLLSLKMSVKVMRKANQDFHNPKMTDYDAKKLAEELRKLNDLKEDRDYWKKKAADLQKQEQIRYQIANKKKNSITIGGYSGIEIPLDEAMKKQINDYIYKEIRQVIESDEDFEEKFVKAALNYKKAFVHIFKPVVEDIIRDIDFNVSFNRDD